MERDEADERREAVIASAPTLRPNFKPKTGITDSQLSKFQELHRRRLQIKAKSKIHKRDKKGANGRGKSNKNAAEDQEFANRELIKPSSDSSSALETKDAAGTSSSEVDKVSRNAAAKTRQKLYWGLDTKERWERKSNM